MADLGVILIGMPRREGDRPGAAIDCDVTGVVALGAASAVPDLGEGAGSDVPGRTTRGAPLKVTPPSP
ncbi:MAG: hypothetical protein R3F31_25680 [Verrucomicrobiales bacterium]